MPPQSDAVVVAFQRRQARVLAQVSAAVGRSWTSLPAYRSADLAAFLATVEAALPAAQSAMAASVDAMVAILSESPPVGIPVEVYTEVRGIPLAEEYTRPFLELWKGLNDGQPLDDLVQAGEKRVRSMATMDTQKAMVNAMDHVADAQPRIIGYRRTLTGKSCVFCAAASTKRYYGRSSQVNRIRLETERSKGDFSKAGKARQRSAARLVTGGEHGPSSGLMPLHDHCDCGVAPILSGQDPGQVVNRDLLDTLKARGPDYWKQSGFVDADGLPFSPTDIPQGLTRVVEHGELGPILQAA